VIYQEALQEADISIIRAIRLILELRS